MRMKVLVVCVSVLSVLCVGCFCFFPRTGARGVVVDQYNNPVPNASMQASWVPVALRFFMLPPQQQRNFNADERGNWSFYSRGADGLFIEATGGDGCEVQSLGFDKTRIGPLRSGACLTNIFILHLNRIEPALQPKDAK